MIGLALLLACADEPGDTADSGLCVDAPVVTYNSFGRAFVERACQPCHATPAPDRYGAPEGVVFDTVEDTWRFADSILARAAGDAPTMPPAGGTTEDQRTKLLWWLTCAEPGT